MVMTEEENIVEMSILGRENVSHEHLLDLVGGNTGTLDSSYSIVRGTVRTVGADLTIPLMAWAPNCTAVRLERELKII